MTGAPRVVVGGFGFDPVTTEEVARHVIDALARGIGGRLVTPNVDILRTAVRDPRAMAAIEEADIVVADGMPLVWASRLAGTPLPERVAGASLVELLIGRAATASVPVVLIGGGPGVAERAAVVQSHRHPELSISSHFPPFGFDDDPTEMARISQVVGDARAGIVLCGIGFPRQDLLGAWLLERHPGSWFVGCGGSIAFLAGEVARAPSVLQAAGLEWVHRLAMEPRRLAGRYARDLPHAVSILARAAGSRRRRLR